VSLYKLQLTLLKKEQLHQVVELDQLSLGGLWCLDSYQKELESPNSVLLVLSSQNLRRDGSISGEKLLGLGCFWSILEEAHITILMVHPDFQGQGLGQLLLWGLLNYAVQKNLERATLEVRTSNGIALSLYEKFGFKTAGRRRGYYQDTGEDAFILWRNGLHYPEFKHNLSQWQQQIHQRLLQKKWIIDN
jgi:[ribosomal protein S18]-alanine N-acetyltransferase